MSTATTPSTGIIIRAIHITVGAIVRTIGEATTGVGTRIGAILITTAIGDGIRIGVMAGVTTATGIIPTIPITTVTATLTAMAAD